MNLENATKAFTALSQKTRLEVFKILVEYGKTGVSAGTISDRLNIPHNSLSFHLSHLSKAGLVSSKKDGRQMIYSTNISSIEGLISYLNLNSHTFTHEPSPQEYHNQKVQKSVSVFL